MSTSEQGAAPEGMYRSGLTVVGEDFEGAIGDLLLYSLPGKWIPDAMLRAAWGRAGLDSGLLPGTPRLRGAFLASCKDAESTVRAEDGTRVDVLSKTVIQTKEELGVQFNWRLTLPELRSAEYPRALKIILARATRQLRVEEPHSTAVDPRVAQHLPSGRGLVAKVRATFAERADAHPPEALRTAVRQTLLGANATLVRESGGVWFCPRAAGATTRALKQVVGELVPGSEFHLVPVADDAEQREMVRRHFVSTARERLDRQLEEATSAARAAARGEDLPDLVGMIRQRRTLSGYISEYREILGTELSEVAGAMGMLDRALEVLMRRQGTTDAESVEDAGEAAAA